MLNPDDAVSNAIAELKKNGVDISHPNGYPEIASLVRQLRMRSKVSLEQLEKGKYYLIRDRYGDEKVICIDNSTVLNSQYWEEFRFFASSNNRLGSRGGSMEFKNGLLYAGVEGWLGSFSRSKITGE